MRPRYRPEPVGGGPACSAATGSARRRPRLDRTGLDPLVGADVVEVAPADDHAEVTALAAASVALDLVTLMVKRPR